jgi:phage host-nuclease inhibitor protein Gam
MFELFQYPRCQRIRSDPSPYHRGDFMGKRTVPIVEDAHEAEDVMAEIKMVQSQTVSKHAAYLKEIERLEDKLRAKKVAHKTMLEAQQRRVRDLILGLFRFAKMHRGELTRGGKQIRFPLGSTAQWRATSRILITDATSAANYVMKHKLTDFFKLKVTLKKREMNTQWLVAKDIPGVSKKDGENFVVKPVGVEEPISHTVEELDRELSIEPAHPVPHTQSRELVSA